MATILHNTVSNQKLRERLAAETEPRLTISLYKYFKIADPQDFRDRLYMSFKTLDVFGRVYIATEGINAQISVLESRFEAFRKMFYAFDPALDGLRLNVAIEDNGKSFWVLRMKVRHRILADGIEDPAFDPTNVGTYLKAQEVNEMMEDPDTIFVDMRNHYEYEVGHFKSAREIPAATYREQLPKTAELLKDDKDKNIVLYCTGGIRCEKTSAYLHYKGFDKVYHIEGGIIEYTRRAKEQGLPLKFLGKNFVFDERMGERITDDVLAACHHCGKSCDRQTNCKNDACHRLMVQCEDCAAKYEGCCDEKCQQEMHLPANQLKALVKERSLAGKLFSKSRS